uniref:RNase H type-1 domain-containing protein n=1 Tax=Brassica oleracea var. oleracea TaxID=109376 RepID=A0A0D3DUX0_BRAOL
MESKKRKRKGFHEPSTKLGFGENEEEGSSVGEVKVRMLSIDAAWNAGTGQAGLGWVLTQTEATSSFSKIAKKVPSPLMAEGLALREALQKRKDLGIKTLNVESDSKNLINSILNDNTISELYGIVADILLLSGCFDFVSFRWISREANYAVDLVAKTELWC